MQIANDTVVSIDYRLYNSGGELLDSSEAGQPLAYLHGHGNIVPGLEEALEGKQAGDEIKVAVPPEKAYGARHPELVQTAPLSAFPTEQPPEVGSSFKAEHEGGSTVVTVTAIEGDQVTVDGNHVLAGQDLNFEVTVVEVRAATGEEVEHEHAH